MRRLRLFSLQLALTAAVLSAPLRVVHAQEEPTVSPRLRAFAGVRLASRSFRYTDTLASLLPGNGYAEPLPQSFPAFPALHLSLDSFPWRGDGWLDHLGFFTSLDVGPFLRARAGTESFDQSYVAFHGGVQGHVALGPVSLVPRLGYGIDSFHVAPQPALPSVRYAFMSSGIGARFERDGVSVEVRGDLRFGLDAGAIQNPSWFPEAHFLGASLNTRVGFDGRFWGASPAWSLSCGVEVLQYGLDFNPIPVGTVPERVAGGATDRTISLLWAVGYAWPESSTSSSGATDDF